MCKNEHVTIEQGILKVEGKPVFVWSADYPYYRDQRDDWAKQLDNLKKMNVNVVTFYIPWRHHAPTDPLKQGGTYDFCGELNDRTDVLEFIRLIHERGMYCVAKPGPYIHAETRYGSLPDYVLPKNNSDIALRIDMDGNASPACWGFPDPPAPMDPAYLNYVEDWFRAVARDVIIPNAYPKGPILTVQVLNEGIYSDGGYDVDKLHFDEPALGHYRAFLEERYGAIADYNETCGTDFGSFAEIPAPRQWHPAEYRGSLLPWIDFAEFGQYFYRKIASTYIDYLQDEGVDLPMVMNINPPREAHGAALETVMGRYTVPALNDVISYGYTNWCGVVSHNEDAWLKYKIVGKMARGINMEENWGFDSYDPPYYWSVQPSYFQSMAYMLWGATGLNIYLGVSCDCWTDHLAVDAGGVYMHNHPIAEDGSYRDAFWTCHQLGALMKNVGDDLVRQDLHEPVAWALYSPYAHAASWDSAPADWKRVGFPDRPHASWFGWDSFMALCEKQKTQNGVCYPREESVERLLKHPVLFIEGNAWMDSATQKKLADYVERGGVLVLTSYVPEYDEFFKPCTILKDALYPFDTKVVADDGGFRYSLNGGAYEGRGRGVLRDIVNFGEGVEVVGRVTFGDAGITCAVKTEHGSGSALFLGFSPWQAESGEWGSVGLIEFIAANWGGVGITSTCTPDPYDGRVEVAEFPCDEAGRRYFFVLTRKDTPDSYRIATTSLAGEKSGFEMRLPAFSGAFAGFEGGRIIAAHIKGYNDLDKSVAAPRLASGGAVLEAVDPCDLYFCELADGSAELSIANLQDTDGTTQVTLPCEAGSVKRIVRVLNDGSEEEVEMSDAGGQISFVAKDMRGPADGVWSPCYRIER